MVNSSVIQGEILKQIVANGCPTFFWHRIFLLDIVKILIISTSLSTVVPFGLVIPSDFCGQFWFSFVIPHPIFGGFLVSV